MSERPMFRAHVADFILTDRGARRRIDPNALLRIALTWAAQFLCGLRGHDMVRQFESQRISLRCLACGAQTCGWALDARPPRPTRASSLLNGRHASTAAALAHSRRPGSSLGGR